MTLHPHQHCLPFAHCLSLSPIIFEYIILSVLDFRSHFPLLKDFRLKPQYSHSPCWQNAAFKRFLFPLQVPVQHSVFHVMLRL